MGLQFYFGASGSGKSEQVCREILEEAALCPQKNFLLIVPDQFTMQTQKDMVLKSAGHGILNIDVLSFGRLTYRIFDEVGGDDLPVLDDTGKSLVLRKVAADVAQDLPVIGKNLNKIGYVHEVKSAISEFMQYGVSVEQLQNMIGQTGRRGALQSKLQDLSVLYEKFSGYIREKYVTTEETLERLCRVLPKSRLVQGSVVVFDGFTGFTPIQNHVIATLTQLAERVIVTLDMDEGEDPYQVTGEQKLFYLSSKAVTALERLVAEQGLDREKDVFLERKKGKVARFEDNPELAHLERYLFRFPMKPYEKGVERIGIYEASTPKEEVHQTCLKIHRLVREEGYEYRQIAVVTGNLEAYAQEVREQFARFGIPVFVDQTRGILLNPFIELIRAALQMLIKDFSYETVFHYLRCGLTGFIPEEVDVLERYILAFGIRGKRAYGKQFVRRNAASEEIIKELETVNVLRERLMEELAPLMEPGETAQDYGTALYHFLEQNQVQKRLAAYETRFQETDPVRAMEYGQIYRLVMDLLDQIVGLLGTESMNLQEFYEILDAGFGEIEVGTIPQNVDRVVVGDMERTRLKQIRTLFFLGVNDGNIPKNTSSGGILSDIDREFLEQVAPDMELAPTPRKQMYIQKLYLYMNMTKPTDKLFLSYAKVSGEGKSLRPAYLIAIMKSLFPALNVEHPEEQGWEAQLYNYEDGLDLLAAGLRQYADGRGKEEMPLLGSLYGGAENSMGGLYDCLEQAAFFAHQGRKLARATAKLLYGQILQNSVSRLEQFASCEYAHFLQYGLQLSEREEYEFEASDLGTIFHGILEIFGHKVEEHGSTWLTFTPEEAALWVHEAIEEFAVNYGESILYSSARREYVLTRMERVMGRTVRTLQHQLQKGVFTPSQFEMKFTRTDTLADVDVCLSAQEKMELTGRIDRVDTFETPDKIYVKVLDYKSGRRQLDLVSVYYGLQLQLVVYLNAALEKEKTSHPGQKVVPAGILYYRMADPLVEESGGSEEQIRNEIFGQLRTVGLLNESEEVLRLMDKDSTSKSDVIPVEWKKDGSLSARSQVASKEQIQQISNYVNQKIKHIGAGILRGEMALNPYEKGQQSSCTYCSYKNVCGFDRQMPGMAMRQLEELTEEQVYEKMTEAEGKGEA